MIRIRQIKVKIRDNNLEDKICEKLKISKDNLIDYKIVKKSIDSRKKDDIYFVYEVDVNIKDERILNKIKSLDIFETKVEEYNYIPKGTNNINGNVVVVGSGPAGLFSAYMLSLNGYNPIIIERGSDVDTRVKKVEEFFNTNKLDEECNVQFGEGGAGTFSDGKLNTMVKDKFHRGKKVFEVFVQNGAPEEIMYDYMPHIGTDLLRDVIKNIRNVIIKNGGTFRFNTKLTDIIINNNTLEEIVVNNNEHIKTNALVLAIGHSARDTFYMLNNYLKMEAKPFAVGLRISHKQSTINKNQYGDFYKLLPPASYKLTYTTNSKRGVYTFCMCPGGYVVNSSSEKGLLAINGMSEYKRDSENANSAVIVTVSPNDFGTSPLSGIEFQRKLEKKAYELGKGNIPVQLYKDFKENRLSKSFKSINPIFKGNYTFANLRNLFPSYINDSLIEGIDNYDKKIKGFADDDTILAGVESRTSSPVRIIRNEDFLSNIEGIYPCGEGAGYAGGITSAAIDGIKVSEAIMDKYHK